MHAPLAGYKFTGQLLWSEPQVTGSRWQVEPEAWSGFACVFHAPKCWNPIPHPETCISQDFAEEQGARVQSACSTRQGTFKSQLSQLPLRVLNECCLVFLNLGLHPGWLRGLAKSADSKRVLGSGSAVHSDSCCANCISSPSLSPPPSSWPLTSCLDKPFCSVFISCFQKCTLSDLTEKMDCGSIFLLRPSPVLQAPSSPLPAPCSPNL